MTWKIMKIGLLLSFAGCSTMNRSLQLGAGMGMATGAAATLTGSLVGGQSPSLGTVAIGASIGSAVGLLTSYLIHKEVAEDRSSYDSNQIEMRFGDLPPSPFVVPKALPTKGGR